MDFDHLDRLENLRHTLAQEARRCHADAAYVDFLFREWRHYTARIEREWRQSEGAGVVPARYRNAREGAERRGERRAA